MSLLSRVAGALGYEKRGTLEDPSVPISNKALMLKLFGMDEAAPDFAKDVTIDSALTVPAVAAAVTFISAAFASQPLQLFKVDGDGNHEKVSGGLATVLGKAPTKDCTSFDWRNYSMSQVLTGGRQFSFIDRNSMGRVLNIHSLDPDGVTIKKTEGVKTYHYRDGASRPITYDSDEIIDIPWMLARDMLSHRSPIMLNRNTIGLALAATKYGGRYFANGGVPPFAIEGPFKTPGGIQRAADDLDQAVREGAERNRLAVSIPEGHKLHDLGGSPEKAQLVDVKVFLLQEFARIYNLPPVFLHDLSSGTFSNTSQQDLHFVKHCLARWCWQWEQELNLKLFGRQRNEFFVKVNLDALLRGDFKTRMEGYARGIQSAVYKPNEARKLEDLPEDDKGNELLIQGATVPLGTQHNFTINPQSGGSQESDDDA